MKILLLGKNGQLGWELQRTLAPLGLLFAIDIEQLDLQDVAGIRRMVRVLKPGLIVNASAYTDVDRAEAEPEKARAVNAAAPAVLAEEARRLEALLIHYSTDYVFDGTKGSPYREEDAASPLNVYGRSKLDGEEAIREAGGSHLILRTSWVYSLRGGGFVSKVLEWARKQEQLRVVTDQIGCPTWARQLAETTAQLVARGSGNLRERSGLYHLAGSGHASRFEWAQAILELDPHREEQVARAVIPASSSDFPSPARRPLFSALNCDRFESTFKMHLPDWQTTLGMAMGQ